MKNIRRINKLTIIILVITIALNVLIWCSTPFCTWYTTHVFPLILGTYGRFTGLFDFSVGEVMIVIAVLLLIMFIVSLAVLIPCKIRKKGGRMPELAKQYMRAFALIVVCVGLVMSLNCFVLYHAQGFAGEHLSVKEEYTLSELREYRNELVKKCNELAKLQERDTDGNVVYSGDIRKESVSAMKRLGEKYPRLSGYYPMPKYIRASKFLSQQYVAGIFYPFSMEANVNSMMYIMNYPATICHELAHLKGYIYEDEANLIGYIACVTSDDVFFQYSGYLSVLYYVDNQFFDALEDKYEYMEEIQIDAQVRSDNVFLTAEAWETVEESAVVSTEVVEQVADKVIDTSLKVNGVEEGAQSYSLVVRLLLAYEEDKSLK